MLSGWKIIIKKSKKKTVYLREMFVVTRNKIKKEKIMHRKVS